MMRPIDELMAYYAFGQVKMRRNRRPRLSPEAQELANEFEALIGESTTLSTLLLHFKSRFAVTDLAKLYELYQQANFQILENASEVDMDVDLAFEQKVSHFTRMQERERMRQRFKELAEEELVMASNSVSDDDMLMNIEHHELMPKENKSDESNLWQIVLTIIALGVVAMLIRFLWIFLTS